MNYKAYPSDDEDHIILESPDGQLEYHELFHGQDRASFEAPVMYPRDDVRFILLMEAIDKLNVDLYSKKPSHEANEILGDWSFVVNDKEEIVITHTDGAGVVVSKEGSNDRIAADMLAKLALEIVQLRKNQRS